MSSKNTKPETQDDPIVYDSDVSSMEYMAMAQNPYLGAEVEPGWHYVIVAEHPPAMGLPSNRLKFLQMGYEVAPAKSSIRKRWDEANRWVMRIPQEVYDQRVAEARKRSAENRGVTGLSGDLGVEVVKDSRTKSSLADVMNW